MTVRASYAVLGAFAVTCSAMAARVDFATAYLAYERGDYASASRQFAEAARQGQAAAQISLGWLYAQGLGVRRDDQQALNWYRQAAEQGHPDARAILNIRRLGMIANGRPVTGTSGKPTQAPVDSQRPERRNGVLHFLEHSQALGYWSRRSAEAGNREAQLLLAIRYELGQGFPKDTPRAIYWYRKSAEQGAALAQFNLGLKYAIGEAVPLDQTQATFWYQRAAAQGHLQSQFLLGVAYARGDGVPLDAGQALNWWRVAAQGGHAPAQYQLGLQYAQGNGVARDTSRAFLWFSFAAAQGHDEARRSRDALRMRIGPTELARVQRLVRHWVSPGSLDFRPGERPPIPGNVLPTLSSGGGA